MWKEHFSHSFTFSFALTRFKLLAIRVNFLTLKRKRPIQTCIRIFSQFAFVSLKKPALAFCSYGLVPVTNVSHT